MFNYSVVLSVHTGADLLAPYSMPSVTRNANKLAFTYVHEVFSTFMFPNVRMASSALA